MKKNLEDNTKDVLKEENLGFKDNKKILKYILLIFSILVICSATVGIIIYRYNNLKINTSGNIISTKTNKILNKEYVVDYDYKYFTNPLTFEQKEYLEGKFKYSGETYDKVSVYYVKISGLKDKTIENKINKAIKDEALDIPELKSNEYYNLLCSVEGNFNNILSIRLYSYIYNVKTEKTRNQNNYYLSYDLTSGEIIKFEDVFTSDMPINHAIYELEYKSLAWGDDFSLEWDREKYDMRTNMDKRDTSEFEDIILKAIRNFNDIDRSKIQVLITPYTISFEYELNNEYKQYTVYSYKYKDYVTVYKKYLKNENIFEKSYTANNYAYRRDSSLSIEKLVDEKYSDNAYIDMFEYMAYYDDGELEKIKKLDAYSTIVNYKKNIISNICSEFKKIADSNKNKGYIFRGGVSVRLTDESNDYGSEEFVNIQIDTNASIMAKEYFKNNLYKIYAAQVENNVIDITEEFIGKFKDSNITYDEKYNIQKDIYIDKTGKVVANSYEELESYMNKKYKKNNVNIYSE